MTRFFFLKQATKKTNQNAFSSLKVYLAVSRSELQSDMVRGSPWRLLNELSPLAQVWQDK